MDVHLGDTAPDFTAQTTEGPHRCVQPFRDAEQLDRSVAAHEQGCVVDAGLAQAGRPDAVEKALLFIDDRLRVNLQCGERPHLGSRHYVDRDDISARLCGDGRGPACRGL
jgi:hypothetical protein